MQSAQNNTGELQNTWLQILGTQLQTILHAQGRMEGKIDVLLMARTGPASSPTATPMATSTEASMVTLDPHKIGKWLSLGSTVVRLGITVGPYVTIAARVLWKTVKPWLIG